MVQCLYDLSTVLTLQYTFSLLTVSFFLQAVELEKDIPVFKTRESNVSFYAGETATLRCAVEGLQNRYLVWRRTSEPNPLTIGDFVYSPDDRISLRRIEKNDEWNLIIKDVQPTDAGVYECGISSTEKYRTYVVLRVKGTASRKMVQKHDQDSNSGLLKGVVVSGNAFVSKGQSIFLTCNATGEDYAPDEVDWFIDGFKVDRYNMPRVRVTSDHDRRTLYSTLEIRHSRMTDKGIYVCRGPDSKTASITIHILDEEKSSHIKRGDETPSEGFRMGSLASSLLITWHYKHTPFAAAMYAIWVVFIKYIT